MNSGSSSVAAPTCVVAAMVANAARVSAITGSAIELNQPRFEVCGCRVMGRTVRTSRNDWMAKRAPLANQVVNLPP